MASVPACRIAAGGLPLGEGEDGAAAFEVDGLLQGGADRGEGLLQAADRGDTLPDQVGAVGGEDFEVGQQPAGRFELRDVAAEPDGLGDDDGIAGVGLVFAGERGGHVVGDGAGHVSDGEAPLPEQGEEQSGQGCGEVHRPADGPAEFGDLSDGLEQDGLVVSDAPGVLDSAGGVDRGDVVVGIADVHADPQFRHFCILSVCSGVGGVSGGRTACTLSDGDGARVSRSGPHDTDR